MRPEEVFSQKLLELRTLRGMSQVALGEAADMDPLAILRIEKGRQRVRLDDAVALAVALDVPVSAMLPAQATEHAGIVGVPAAVRDSLAAAHLVLGMTLSNLGGGS